MATTYNKAGTDAHQVSSEHPPRRSVVTSNANGCKVNRLEPLQS